METLAPIMEIQLGASHRDKVKVAEIIKRPGFRAFLFLLGLKMLKHATLPPLSQLHPVVVPQSSQTMQWPETFMRIELQLLH